MEETGPGFERATLAPSVADSDLGRRPRRRRLFLWVALAAFGSVFAVLIFAVGYFAVRGSVPSVEQGSVVELQLAGSLRDSPPPPSFSLPGIGFSDDKNVKDLRELCEAIRKDDRVPALLVRVNDVSAPWGLLEEVRGAIQRVREAKKRVVFLIEADLAGEGVLFLASAADEIVVNPEAAILMDGLLSEQLFFRKALDKLKIEPQFIQFKEYKGAAEPFMREKMSDPLREEVDAVIGDIWDRFVSELAAARKIAPADLSAISDRGMLTALEAVSAKLADRTGYLDEVRESLRGLTKTAKYRHIRADKYARAARKKSAPFGQPKVAVIYSEGQIISSDPGPTADLISGPRMAQMIRDAEEDEDVKAIVVRVNSPGGSAVGSDFVWRQMLLTKKKKPVVVSMGGVAASGGYYVSMAADAIVASPSTITGSIGVVFGKFNVRGLLEHLGVTVDRVQRGKAPDSFSFLSSLTPEQEAQVRNWMQRVYDDFTAKAADGRRKDKVELETLAKGRIWTGAQAKAKGLVDELGGLARAVEIAKEKAKIAKDQEVELVPFPRRKKFLDMLFDEEFLPWMAERSLFAGTGLPPELRAPAQFALSAMERPQVWLLAPDLIFR